jgi:hypothetical protein
VTSILFSLILMIPQDVATYPVVNEVFYDTPGTDSHEEWVEIYNPTGSSVNLSDFKIGDEEVNGGTEGMYEFPDGASIGPNSYIVVCMHDTTFIRMYGFSADYEVINTNSTPNMVKYSSWGSGSFALGNSGDEVLLLDSLDNVLDVVVYEGGSYSGVTAHPGVSTGHSIERVPPGEDTDDCSIDMQDTDPETPGYGAANQPPNISDVWNGPYCPDASENDTVYAVITDDVGLASETVWYSINDGSYNSVSMTAASGDTFYGIIPGQSDAAHVRFYVIAVDNDALADTSDTDGYFAGLTPIDSTRFNDTNGIPLYVGHAIRVTGLVTVNSHTFETTSHIINLQNNGVGLVVKSTNLSMTEVNECDSITACGSISYWSGQTRITSPNSEPFQVEQLNKRTPDIYVLDYDDFYDYVGDTMNYEGLLVGLINADNYSGTWGSAGTSFGIWLQEFGASPPPDTVEMWIDNDTDIDDNPEPTWPKDVVGVYSQYDITLPYWSGYEIMPRSYEDFLDAGSLPLYLTEFFATVEVEKIILTWRTETERDGYLYEVRRSKDVSSGCDHAEIIGEVEAQGNSSGQRTYTFIDDIITPRSMYYYWVIGITQSGQRIIRGPVSAQTTERVFSVSKPYPNPFARRISLECVSNYESQLDVKVYDVTGRGIRTLASLKNFKGHATIIWDGSDEHNRKVGEGIYYIRVKTHSSEIVRKVLFMK